MIAQRLHFLLQFLLSSQIYEGNCRESTAEVDPGEVRRLKSKSYYVGTHLMFSTDNQETSDEAGSLCQKNGLFMILKLLAPQQDHLFLPNTAPQS